VAIAIFDSENNFSWSSKYFRRAEPSIAVDFRRNMCLLQALNENYLKDACKAIIQGTWARLIWKLLLCMYGLTL